MTWRSGGTTAADMTAAPTLYPQSVQEAFAPLIGKMPAWNVAQGHGSFLTMEFGTPRLEIREPSVSTAKSEKVRKLAARRDVQLRGDFHLWIYCCNWRIGLDDRVLAANESSDDAIVQATRALNGQIITSIRVDPNTAVSSFRFDLGGMLETWPYSLDQWADCPTTVAQWHLYSEVGAFSIRADGRFSSGSLQRRADHWLPLGSAEAQAS